jgi:UDP-N-acetylmuramate dehydrogenase
MTWYSGLEPICHPDVPLADYTWYGLGGPAEWFVTPRDEAELCEVLRRCHANEIPVRVLGKGANLLVRDEGVHGVVLHLASEAWSQITFDGPAVHAGAGADFTQLVRQSVERSLAGLETLAGIPGTVGGIVCMNAGGKYGEAGETLHSARVALPTGELRDLTIEELAPRYRHTNLQGGVVCSARFELQPGDAPPLLARFRDIWQEKAASQPAVAAKSAGCIFKNAARPAGWLIDQAGLKGHRCGGAEISTKHANFIVAYPGATAGNVLELIDVARDRVREKHGIELELEVEVW